MPIVCRQHHWNTVYIQSSQYMYINSTRNVTRDTIQEKQLLHVPLYALNKIIYACVYKSPII